MQGDDNRLTCVSRVDFHSFEAVMRREGRAGPFPDASQSTLAGESVAVLSDWGGVPVFKPNVTIVEVDKHWRGVCGRGFYWLVVRGARSCSFDFVNAISIDTIDAICPVANVLC